MRVEDMPPDPKHPGKHINPETGIWPACEWGNECKRGFSRNERFGGTRVIAGTNREITRKWRQLNEDVAEGHNEEREPNA